MDEPKYMALHVSRGDVRKPRIRRVWIAPAPHQTAGVLTGGDLNLKKTAQRRAGKKGTSMTTPATTQELLQQVERHLDDEDALVEELRRLNTRLERAMTGKGMRGPSGDEIHAVSGITQNIERISKQFRTQAINLINDINQRSETSYRTLGSFLDSLPQHAAGSLRDRHLQLLRTAQQAWATLQSNHASLCYSVDFHQRYVAGLCQVTERSERYTGTGQLHQNGEGNLIRKTC